MVSCVVVVLTLNIFKKSKINLIKLLQMIHNFMVKKLFFCVLMYYEEYQLNYLKNSSLKCLSYN